MMMMMMMVMVMVMMRTEQSTQQKPMENKNNTKNGTKNAELENKLKNVIAKKKKQKGEENNETKKITSFVMWDFRRFFDVFEVSPSHFFCEGTIVFFFLVPCFFSHTPSFLVPRKATFSKCPLEIDAEWGQILCFISCCGCCFYY